MFITSSDSSVRYIGRWSVLPHKSFCATPGARFLIAFSGREAALHFSTAFMSEPHPHLWVSVDGGARVETPIDKHLRVQAASDGNHVVNLIFKSAIEMAHRWYSPLDGRIEFLGYDAKAPGALPAPLQRTMEFVGDSITEGVLADSEQSTNLEWFERPYQDDAAATYAYLTAEALGLEPLIMGYGGVGLTTSGSGSVPNVLQSYPYCFNTVEIPYRNPDYIVIHQGTNDAGRCDSGTFEAAYQKLLGMIRAMHPRSRIIALQPFCGAFGEEIRRAARLVSADIGADILFLPTEGWNEEGRIHPTRAGHRIVAAHLIQALKDADIGI